MGNFDCDTNTPGCKNVCFNTFTPISLMRYWSLQILLSALPGIVFITYVDNKERKVELAGRIKQKKRANDKKVVQGITKRHRELEKGQSKARKRINLGKESFGIDEVARSSVSGTETDSSSASDVSSLDSSDNENHEFRATNLRSKNMPPRVFLFYELQVVLRACFELAFTIGQYFIYPFHFRVPEMWECTHFGRPCLNRHTSCYIARPMEKTIFIGIMYGTSILMVLISIYELYSLGWVDTRFAFKHRSEDITKEYRIEDKDLPAHLRKNSRRNRKKARGITGKMESYRIRELRESLSGSGADLNQAKYLV